MLEITFADRFSLRDGTIEQWLSERRLIALIMTETAIPIHIYHDVTREFESKIHREPDDLRDRFRILTVDVKDRDLKHLGDISSIGAGTRFDGAGRETYLVIHDDVEGATYCVGIELTE